MHKNLSILIEISVKIRMAKKMRAVIVSCVMNGEFYFASTLDGVQMLPNTFYKIYAIYHN